MPFHKQVLDSIKIPELLQYPDHWAKDTYKNMHYVMEEVKSLAEQLREVEVLPMRKLKRN